MSAIPVNPYAGTEPVSPGHPPHRPRRAFTPRRPPPEVVEADMTYVVRPAEKAFTLMYDPPVVVPRENFQFDVRRVAIADARSSLSRLNIHREGFELWDAPSGVADFRDEHAVARHYYPECAELACAVTGAVRGFVFDHVIRKREEGRPPLTFGRHGDGSSPAANGRVHNDYTDDSGRSRLSIVLRDVEFTSEVARYSIVNIWRSISGPILDTPLAVCDARTVSAMDLVPTEIRYQERKGEIYLFERSSRHCWSFFPEMDRQEALVFKQFDSQVSGVSRFTPHAAFDLPYIPPDAPLRESIEVRCLVVYD